jgi:predicted nucleotidyltransferase
VTQSLRSGGGDWLVTACDPWHFMGMELPAFTDKGDLPPGVHKANLAECLEHFGSSTPRRRMIALRLGRIYQVAIATGKVARFAVFGSFVSTKIEPNDVDVFMVMEDSFDASKLVGEARMLFDHGAAQTHFGGSVFWLRRLAALDGEQAAIENWQIKRDGTSRGIVEIVEESS